MFFKKLIILLTVVFNIISYPNQKPCGFAEMQGKRPTMEDAHCIEINNEYAFFGLFDGHGGRKVADYAADNLYKNIINNTNFKINKSFTSRQVSSLDQKLWQTRKGGLIIQAIHEGYLKTNDDLDVSLGKNIANKQGCTALTVLIKNKQIYIANTGDSRAVLGSKGIAIPLSYDHKPNRPDEKERIKNLGGQIIFNGCHRVLGKNGGGLALSRAIGDKALFPYVIPDPEIIIKKTGGHGDLFIILACDGVWDVLSNQQAVDIVYKSLKNDKYLDCDEAAKKLIESAYNAGSTDNISAIIIDLTKF